MRHEFTHYNDYNDNVARRSRIAYLVDLNLYDCDMMIFELTAQTGSYDARFLWILARHVYARPFYSDLAGRNKANKCDGGKKFVPYVTLQREKRKYFQSMS